jgi:hypothetical protein
MMLHLRQVLRDTAVSDMGDDQLLINFSDV